MLVRQPAEEVTRKRTDRERSAFARVAHRVDVIEAPADLACTVVRGDDETGLIAHQRACLVDLRHVVRGAPVLP